MKEYNFMKSQLILVHEGMELNDTQSLSYLRLKKLEGFVLRSQSAPGLWAVPNWNGKMFQELIAFQIVDSPSA